MNRIYTISVLEANNAVATYSVMDNFSVECLYDGGTKQSYQFKNENEAKIKVLELAINKMNLNRNYTKVNSLVLPRYFNEKGEYNETFRLDESKKIKRLNYKSLKEFNPIFITRIPVQIPENLHYEITNKYAKRNKDRICFQSGKIRFWIILKRFQKMCYYDIAILADKPKFNYWGNAPHPETLFMTAELDLEVLSQELKLNLAKTIEQMPYPGVLKGRVVFGKTAEANENEAMF